MCIAILTDKIITARKKHRCFAFDEIILAGLCENDLKDMLTDDEFKEYLEAKKNDFKIQIGDKYRFYTSPQNGTICTIRESLLGNKLCIKYDLYEEC